MRFIINALVATASTVAVTAAAVATVNRATIAQARAPKKVKDVCRKAEDKTMILKGKASAAASVLNNEVVRKTIQDEYSKKVEDIETVRKYTEQKKAEARKVALDAYFAKKSAKK